MLEFSYNNLGLAIIFSNDFIKGNKAIVPDIIYPGK